MLIKTDKLDIATKIIGFKMTELGPLPEDWEVVRLGEVAQIIMGQSPPGDTYNEIGEGIPFLQGKAEFTDIFPIPKKYTTKPIKVAPKGSILISVRAPVGDVNLVDREYCIGRGLAAICVTNKANKKFVFWGLKYLKPLLEKEGSGSTFKSINKEKLINFLIPLPPLPEQKAIARVLKAIQDAIEATERVIAAAKELKKSLMRHLFTYGPVPVSERDRVRLKETEIGPIPEDWEVVRLGEICDVKGGKRLPKGHSFSEIPTKFPYIRVVDFMNWTVDTKNLKYLTEEDAKLLQRYRIFSEDVFISIAGTVGLVGMIPKELNGAYLTENAARIIIKDFNILEPNFLVAFLASARGQYEIDQRTTKTSQPKLALTRIREIPIPLPPLPIQQKIAQILKAVDDKIEAEEKKKEALQALFKTLLHHLMTGKIRVKY